MNWTYFRKSKFEYAPQSYFIKAYDMIVFNIINFSFLCKKIDEKFTFCLDIKCICDVSGAFKNN